MAGLEAAEHARADAGVLRHVGQCQVQFLADAARDVTDPCGDLGAVDQGPRGAFGG